ncbi:hypothetical protein [Chitinophaga japonensis]|uniref:Uncharacterized protein n=1 Tax=Chitinophaga japonensis TaxID=104662 RepID=A0A562T3D7_CHIJA|nr:hypothetical protein [Chitinophaga japonensis]TWI87913.1 hypothetical protein LX66_1987 [Chitinophaga japonensis]
MSSNIPLNRVSATITAEDLQAVRQSITAITEKLPFLTGLTDDEKKRLPKIDGSNKTFVEDALQAIKTNSTLVPSFVNPEEMSKDLALFMQLDEIHLLLQELTEKVRSTQTVAGSEAYSSALMSYRLFQAAAQAGVPGAASIFNHLRQRFSGQGRSQTAPESTPSE